MDENTQAAGPAENQMRMDFREVPTLFVDFALSYSLGGEVARIMLGELIYDHNDGAVMPRGRAVANLAVPLAAIPSFIALLQQIRDVTGPELQNAS